LTDPEAIASTVVDALEDYQQLSKDVYEQNPDDPEAVVKTLVRLHLRWTEENRDTAILIARHRNEVAAGPKGERLAEGNKEMFKATRAWIDQQAAAGRMPATSFNLMHAIVFAPTQEIAKLWLTGRLKTPLADQADALADAAWAGVAALPDGGPPGS
jgi:AcrR family transcriptional regulator